MFDLPGVHVLTTAAARPMPSAPSALLRSLEPWLSPESLDFWVQHVRPTWSVNRTLAKVVARRVEARGVITLVLKPNGHWQGHVPGQHVNVSAEVGGRRVTRSYSLSGVQGRKGCIAITVKRVPGGVLSAQLCEHTRRGDVLELGQAFGDMTWSAQPSGSWLFLSAGSGITPFMGLIQAMSQTTWPVKVHLVHWASQRADLCFKAALDDMAQRDPRLSVQWVLTREPDVLPGEQTGRLSADWLQAHQPQWAQSQVRACGSAGFVAVAKQAVAGGAGFQAEAFSPMRRVGSSARDEVQPQVQLTLKRSGRTLSIPTGEPLLDALRAQGLNPPSGCGMGICHSCVCTRLEGSVTDVQTGQQHDEPGMPVRLCVSRACSDLSLDL